LTSGPLGPALAAEALGTFALVFVGCGAIAVGDVGTSGVAAAFGLAIMTMVFALGHVSGAHFNPAVTAGFAACRHFPLPRVGPYWAAQVGGAILAAALLRISLGDRVIGVTSPAGSVGQAFVWEVVLTFFLMLVIVAVATDVRAVCSGGGDRDRCDGRDGRARRRSDQRGVHEPGAIDRPRAGERRRVGSVIYLVAPPIGAILAVLVYRYLRSPA
jgi:aquaporin NIP